MKTTFSNFYFFLLLTGLGLLGGLISCNYYQSDISRAISDLSSELAENNNNNNDDDDDDDDRRRRTCDNRDSCQDICDDMFRSVSSRSTCYDESNRNVDTLQEVYDTLADSSISERELESLDPEDFGFFLSMNEGGDDFIDIIQGNHQFDGYNKSNSKTVLEWIARNEEIASEIRSYDRNNEILFVLMERRVDNSISNVTGSNNNNNIRIDSHGLSYDNQKETNELDFDRDLIKFTLAFTGREPYGYGNSEDESFIEYAGSKNEESIELAHQTLASVCQDAVDETDIEDKDVKKCMLAVYCSIDDDEFPNFFDENPIHIDDRKEKACSANTFNDNRKVENYF